MRENLFRGKAINRDKGAHRTSYKNGDWVYGLLTQLYDDRFENLPAEMKNEDGVGGIEIDYRTIGQYIGSTDKNGKKIFEDDIVKLPLFTNGVQAVGIVFWHNRYAKFCIKTKHSNVDFYSYLAKEVIVIGNIHDNPELLEGGAEK